MAFDDAPSVTSVSSIEILDGADRTPELAITVPDSAEPGESVDITATVNGFYRVENLQLFIGGKLIVPEQSSSSSVYHIANQYRWPAGEGTHLLRAVATAEDGTAVETTESITVSSEPVEGSCQAAQ